MHLCRKLTERGKGILILVDELQANSSEVRQLVIAYQELVGERQNVALVMAGLPAAVSATLNDKVLTFLNRARKLSLDSLALGDVDAFFARSFKQLGLRVEPDLRRQATQATCGFPYMLQLVGHYLVLYAGEDGVVDSRVLEDALATSRSEFENDVCETTLAALSEKDVEFLHVMSADEAEGRMSDIAERMGVTSDYAQKYRKRLISAGVIEVAGRGLIRL